MADAAQAIPEQQQPQQPQAAEPDAQLPPDSGIEEQSAVEAPVDEISDIEQQIEPRTWKFEGDFTIMRSGESIPQHFSAEYVQKPLSYFGFLEFTGLLARKINEAMTGPDGITVKDIVETSREAVPYVVDGSRIEALAESGDWSGVDAFVQGLMKVASYVPDVIEECQFIWLRVPRRERQFLREIWGRPADEGGMTNDEGEEMLSLFIYQNYEELETFFVERLPRLGNVAAKARQRIKNKSRDGSPRSRPWRDTAEPIQSQ